MKKFIIAAIILSLAASTADAAKLRLNAPETAPVGQPFFVEMRTNEELGDVTVKWRGKQYTLAPRFNAVRTILGFPNDSKLIGKYSTLTIEFKYKGKIVTAERKIKAASFHYPRQEIKVAPKMVNPPKKENKRIAAEQKLTTKALATSTKGLPFPKKLFRPVAGIPTAYFGGFRVYNGVPRSGHGGLDLRAAVGTNVKAVADGTVVLAGNHYFSGGCVYIDHGSGVLSAYFHLSKPLVEKGQKVRAGDIIALSGATGRVTGPHLHLGIYAGGTWLDALPLIGEAELPKSVTTIQKY